MKSFYALLIVVVVGAVALICARNAFNASGKSHVTIGGVDVTVDVAVTDADRQKGLSGRAGLGENEGMLFVFQQSGSWGMWMKDMRFPIDIIWADAGGTVVSVAPSVDPSTYPQVFYPQNPARFVLEAPAGFAKLHAIDIGSTMTIPYNLLIQS